MDEDDRIGAEALVKGLAWLGRGGRESALALCAIAPELEQDADLGEALDWLATIYNGEPI